MRIAVCIAAVVLAGCISGPLAAQTAADVASDQELLAAYCLGREEQGLPEALSTFPNSFRSSNFLIGLGRYILES
jgi:hypothetical protein